MRRRASQIRQTFGKAGIVSWKLVWSCVYTREVYDVDRYRSFEEVARFRGDRGCIIRSLNKKLRQGICTVLIFTCLECVT